MGTSAGSRAIDRPESPVADRQGTADFGDPPSDLVRRAVDPNHEGVEVTAVETNAGTPDAALARGELLHVALHRDPVHSLVRGRVDPDDEGVLPGLLGRQADPDGTLADRDVLRMRSDGHDGGDTRLKLDGFPGGLPCGPIDGSSPKPQPKAGDAGG